MFGQNWLSIIIVFGYATLNNDTALFKPKKVSHLSQRLINFCGSSSKATMTPVMLWGCSLIQQNHSSRKYLNTVDELSDRQTVMV